MPTSAAFSRRRSLPRSSSLKRWTSVVLPLLISWPCFAFADQPSDDVHVHFRLWTEAAFTASAPNEIAAGGEVEVHGPIYWPGRLDGLVSLAITQAATATSFDFTSPDTWGTYAAAKFALWKPIGYYHQVPAGFVYIAPEARYRFFTNISKNSFPAAHYLREYGAGFRFGLVDISGEEKATLTVVYGPDQRCGDFGYGQVSIDAVVPIADIHRSGTSVGDVAFGADSCLSVGQPSVVRQRDALEARVIVEWGKK